MARLKLAYEDVRAVNPRSSTSAPSAIQPARALRGEGRLRRPDPGRGRPALAAAKQGGAERRATCRRRRRPLGRPARRQRGVRRALPPREDRQGPARRRADVREPAADGAGRAPGRLHLRAAARARPATRACSPRSAAPTRRRTATSACWSTTTSSGARSSTLIGRPETARRTRASPRQEARSRDFESAYALVAEEMKKRTHRRMDRGAREAPTSRCSA